MFLSSVIYGFKLLFQGSGMCEALESENQIRRDCNNGSDLLYSHEDLKLGVKGDLAELTGGHRVKFSLGSNFSYRAVLLDAQKQTEPFVYHCGVFLVPKVTFCQHHESLYKLNLQKLILV